MPRLLASCLILLAILLPGAVPAQDSAAPAVDAAPRTVLQLVVDGPISPASAAYVERGIEHAAEEGADAVLLQMDTPGGLDTSMRSIIKAIMSSPVPVIGYVAPSGSRAASAGTYILQACHVAAMAPATNLGAATPIQIIKPPRPEAPERPGDEVADADEPAPAAAADAESRKALNDAIAYIRSLAEQRGRNPDWVEAAVRDAASISADKALAEGVIDIVAANVASLLREVDGRSVDTAAGTVVLRTARAEVVRVEPNARARFLAVIANPSIAYLLLMIGIFGLLLEGYHPGAVVPGVVGAIALLLALYAFQLLPVNFAGLALIVLGIILMVGEAFVPTYGALGIGGVVSLVTGSVILMDTDVPGFGLPLPLLVGTALVAALMAFGISWLALRSWRKPQVSGAEEMAGLAGRVLVDFDAGGLGRVLVHGESWRARSIDGAALARGDAVRVRGIDGLELQVEPAGDGNFSGETQ